MKTRKAHLQSQRLSDDKRINLGLDNCAKAAFKRGKLGKTENIELDVEITIQGL